MPEETRQMSGSTSMAHIIKPTEIQEPTASVEEEEEGTTREDLRILTYATNTRTEITPGQNASKIHAILLIQIQEATILILDLFPTTEAEETIATIIAIVTTIQVLIPTQDPTLIETTTNINTKINSTRKPKGHMSLQLLTTDGVMLGTMDGVMLGIMDGIMLVITVGITREEIET